MRLKLMAFIILALVLSYTIFWHYMAGEVKHRFEQWVKAEQSEEFSVRYDDLEISGFPYRMEFSFKSLAIVQKRGHRQSIQLHIPVVTMIAFPWKINHGVIISEGGEARLGNREKADLLLAFNDSRASVMIDFTSRKLQRLSVVLNGLQWTKGPLLTDGNNSMAREVKFHILTAQEPVPAESMELPVKMKLYMEASDVFMQEIPVGLFGKKAEQVKIDLQLHGKKWPSFNREGIAEWRDDGGTLAINIIEIISGQVDMELAGEATLDQDMKPLGAFSATVHGSDHIIKILSEYAEFKSGPGGSILDELRAMSKIEVDGLHKGKSAFDVAISMQGGLLFLGPIPIYELPPVMQ